MYSTFTAPTVLLEEAAASQVMFRNGSQKNVQITSKTTPFVMDVVFPNMPPSRTRFSAALFYDGEDDQDLRLVDGVRYEPMTAKIHVSELGDRVSVTCRMNVLTSQHEDSLFRVRVTATLLSDPAVTSSVLSSPIWVVSKTAQALKLVERGPKPLPVPSCPAPAKRPADPIMEVLERMERRQMEQQKAIDRIFSSGSRVPDPADCDFDDAFERFLGAYSRLSPDQKEAKIRRIATNAEFMDICSSVSTSATLDAVCTLCSDDVCPHRRELDSMQQFFDQFVHSPDSTPEI